MVGIIVWLGVLSLTMLTVCVKEAQGKPISNKNIIFILAFVIVVGFIYFASVIL